MTDTWTDRLSEYVDGDLDAETRAALERHLDTCADCRETIDSLRRVVVRAREMRYREPATDLWSTIHADIEKSRVQPIRAPRGRRLVTVSVTRLAIAAALVAAIAGGLAWSMATRQSERQMARQEDGPHSETRDARRETRDVLTEVRPVETRLASASYRDAVADLERAFAAGRGSLKPETMRVIEENLRSIDVAIAQADSALRQDPGSQYLNQYLAETRQRKLKLLRRAVEITTARS